MKSSENLNRFIEEPEKLPIMNISLICPSRNNLKYLKWSINSIIKNKGTHNVEVCVWDDFSDDGTVDWLKEFRSSDIELKWGRNNGPTRLGHTILYDRIVNALATNDLCMIWHADMYLCPLALDAIENLMYEDERVDVGYGEYWTNRTAISKRIVSLTRIEPPLHPPGPEKIVIEGPLGTTEPEEFQKEEETFLQFLQNNLQKEQYWPNKERITEGVFAPWAFWKNEFLEIGGHDSLFAPQSKEDSDIWNRLLLNGTEFLQTWEGFVYHMTCRGSRFNPTLTTPGTSSHEWEIQNLKSTRNFIRKWGHMVRHDEYLQPIVPHKYNIGFIVNNCSYNLLYNLEPWCDHIQCDVEKDIVNRYIEFEQPSTKYDLRKRINSSLKKVPDVIVEIDGHRFNQDDMNHICYLSDILNESGLENSEMGLGNLRLNIVKLNQYETNLILCKNDIYS